MKLDIRKIPFSRFGSYFCVSKHAKTDQIYIRDLHGGDEAPSNVFLVELMENGEVKQCDVSANETCLTISAKGEKDKFAKVILPEEDEIHILANHIDVKLTSKKVKYDSLMEIKKDMYEYHIYPKEIKLMISKVKGEMEVDAPWNIIGNDYVEIMLKGNKETSHLVIESYRTVYKEEEYIEFEQGKKNAEQLYLKWYNSMPEIDDQYNNSKDLAAYITWSSVVAPKGILKDYAMYMSKNWMFNIWSWDNCFNGMMLGEQHPELAWSQFKIFLNTQDESGVYPDFVNDQFISFNCCKPPIFAYAYEKLMKKNDYFNNKERLSKIYESLKKVMGYWETYRTFEGCLPHYKHGNDSGWDNSSLFHDGMPVEAPDLAAHLIKSYDILSKFASILGYEEEVVGHKKKADDMFALLMERLYDEEGFFGRWGVDGKRVKHRTSLILRLPIIIGNRLGKEISDKILTDLEENFETEFGFATEMPTSELYEENGYWLGPIWAPVTYLFIDAINDLGYEKEEKRLSEKFLKLTLKGGMAENFDPFTGEGLVDPSFTWTSSVFLMLGNEQNQRG